MAGQFAWVDLAGLVYAAFAPLLAAADLPPSPPQAHSQAVTTDDAPDELALAAACLERGEETAAVAYLSRHVASHPDQPLVRAYLADLLWRRDRLSEARGHYERFVTDAQLAALDLARQVHAHTRLMAIAQRSEDAYAEHLQRGIGLYLIARQNAAEDKAESEALLCKAAGELTLAQRERPDEARPLWYLHLVWSRLGQSLPAARSLRRAADLADADLTPAERRDLVLRTTGNATTK